MKGIKKDTNEIKDKVTRKRFLAKVSRASSLVTEKVYSCILEFLNSSPVLELTGITFL
jgi:hypothetical protein